jgi:hypothetical protein
VTRVEKVVAASLRPAVLVAMAAVAGVAVMAYLFDRWPYRTGASSIVGLCVATAVAVGWFGGRRQQAADLKHARAAVSEVAATVVDLADLGPVSDGPAVERVLVGALLTAWCVSDPTPDDLTDARQMAEAMRGHFATAGVRLVLPGPPAPRAPVVPAPPVPADPVVAMWPVVDGRSW